MEERIQKILSKTGIASRRRAEELITEGRVLVNGKAATIGMKADLERDYIKVDSKLLIKPEPKIYIMLNKPNGVLTTLEDAEGRPTIKEFIKKMKYRVYPVGRLDFNSEGILLLTNDGEFAYRITHPSYRVAKTYLVKVKGIIDERAIKKLRKGIMLEDGLTAPAKMRKIYKPDVESNSWLEVAIHEGKKRQIRRMLQAVNYPVLRLIRTKIDGVKLGNLTKGQWRPLNNEEFERLKRSIKSA